MLRLPSASRMGAALILSTACERGAEQSILTDPVAQTALRPAPLGVPSSALDAIVEARCARAQRCDRIGEGLDYPSSYDCSMRIRAEWADELNRLECQRGVDEGALRACLRGLSETRCSAEEPGDDCRAVEICDRRPQPFPAPPARDGPVPG